MQKINTTETDTITEGTDEESAQEFASYQNTKHIGREIEVKNGYDRNYDENTFPKVNFLA